MRVSMEIMMEKSNVGTGHSDRNVEALWVVVGEEKEMKLKLKLTEKEEEKMVRKRKKDKERRAKW
jgi:hypothetical protein